MDDIDDDQLRPRISIDAMRAWIRIKTDIQREIEQEAREYATQHNLPPDSFLQSATIYANEVFKIAQSNIRVGGRDYDTLQPHEQDAEPFDEVLDRQIWALAGTRLEWLYKISSDRREEPGKLADRLLAHFREADAIEAQWEAEMPSFMDEDEDMDTGPVLNIDASLGQEIMSVSNELGQTLPAQQERAKRARRVEADIKAIQP
ncbi:hypothetical protein MIND_00861500 [Mycena indigotica]|uniref:Uncharacterized protein n=1 Tax=Mycena indigotica TaxID=2126181 RepID=A0A8H6SI00_9AGAR|nr:uncharacterized protein MIND_00861500 [Mycena indigotica]KAF7299130.1 hypothetical protein MIND_00861500 [Mycena indigotica]